MGADNGRKMQNTSKCKLTHPLPKKITHFNYRCPHAYAAMLKQWGTDNAHGKQRENVLSIQNRNSHFPIHLLHELHISKYMHIKCIQLKNLVIVQMNLEFCHTFRHWKISKSLTYNLASSISFGELLHWAPSPKRNLCFTHPWCARENHIQGGNLLSFTMDWAPKTQKKNLKYYTNATL